MILGMDLSLACPAFAVGIIQNGKVEIVDVSHVTTNSRKGFGYRLFEIYNHVDSITRLYPIEEVAKEKGFSMHVTTTAKLRGVDAVVNLCIYQNLGLEDYPEYAPTTVKKIVTGNGKAEKEDVINNIGRFLAKPVTLSAGKAKEDEADAIGVIITHAVQKKLLK